MPAWSDVIQDEINRPRPAYHKLLMVQRKAIAQARSLRQTETKFSRERQSESGFCGGQFSDANYSSGIFGGGGKVTWSIVKLGISIWCPVDVDDWTRSKSTLCGFELVTGGREVILLDEGLMGL